MVSYQGENEQPSAGIATLPILTTDGKGVFDVTINSSDTIPDDNQIDLQMRLNPVFNLPSIEPRSLWDVDCKRALASLERETKERETMKRKLGLTDDDIEELELELSRSSSPAKFGRRRRRLLENYSSRRRNRKHDAAHSFSAKQSTSRTSTTLIKCQSLRMRRNDELPTVAAQTAEEESHQCQILRRQLGNSLTTIQTLKTAVKNDMLRVQQLYPSLIGTSSRAQTRTFLTTYAAERIATIWDDVLSSLAATGFWQWKTAVLLQKKREKMVKYRNYQGLQKMSLFWERLLRRKVAASFLDWMEEVERGRRAERFAYENLNAKVVQSYCRIHIAKMKANQMRCRKRIVAATKIQNLARNVAARKIYSLILREKAMVFAAMTVQSAFRCYVSRTTLRSLQSEQTKISTAMLMQKMFRGHLGRKQASKASQEKLQKSAALMIQRRLRGRWGYLRFQEQVLKVQRDKAAVNVQKRMRINIAKQEATKKRIERERLESLRRRAVLRVQRIYRGHRGRLIMKLEMRTQVAMVMKQQRAVISIQCWGRQINAKRTVQEIKRERREEMIKNACLWQEIWSEDYDTWFYFNVQTNETVWEPPSSGYKKADSKLVLENGMVIDDPRCTMGENVILQENACVYCEKAVATRLCKQCGDKYCATCYVASHPPGGKREHHTFVRIGPLECDECGTGFATKWCTRCNDPFCDDCWEKIHTTGNRMFHGYCKIDAEGNVSPRAWEADGSSAGVFPAVVQQQQHSQTGGYDEQHPTAEQFSTESFGDDPHLYPQQSGYHDDNWSVYYDDNNVPYYYNQQTGESTYDVPSTPNQQYSFAEHTTTKGETGWTTNRNDHETTATRELTENRRTKLKNSIRTRFTSVKNKFAKIVSSPNLKKVRNTVMRPRPSQNGTD